MFRKWDERPNSFEIWSNLTNQTSFKDYCYSPKTFSNLSEYFECYSLISSEKIVITILELLIAISGGFVNGFVIFCLFVSSTKKTCFDQILVGYCLVNGITAVLIIPFFHVCDIFGYWPFGLESAIIWSTYDNNINYNTSAHMLYASYARLRSLKNPRGYSNELLLKKPFVVMGFIWVLSLAIWGIIMGIIGEKPYSLIVDFDPFYLTTILNLPWLFFMIGVLVITIIIGLFLFEKASKDKQKRAKLKKTQFSILETQSTNLTTQNSLTSSQKKSATGVKKLNRFRLSADKKFLIIMGSYWLQWIAPCIMVLISPFVYIDPGVYSGIYWLTYTVCLTDALNILILNPNIKVPNMKEIKTFFKLH